MGCGSVALWLCRLSCGVCHLSIPRDRDQPGQRGVARRKHCAGGPSRGISTNDHRERVSRRTYGPLCPYDLRHAPGSTWLNAGIPPTQVAEWAGHSVAVLLRVYAKCIAGQEDGARHRVAVALGLPE
jgi:hypothetical protein